jgi:hypothetical protein
MIRSIWRCAMITVGIAWSSGVVFAQSSGSVPATCSINAAGTSLTCTTTVALSGVSGSFANNTLTVTGQASGPQCTGGLSATPSSGITPNVATAISLQACSGNTNRSSLNFRWVSPATAVSGSDPWFGTATATLSSGQSTTYSVDVCDGPSGTALCTRVTSGAVSATGATSFTCSAISPSTSQVVAVNASSTPLNANCSGATSYQWYSGTSPANGSPISGATGASYTPPTSTAGSFNYSVRATNASQQTADSPNSVSVTVQSNPPTGCNIAGEPRVTVNYTTSVQNFTKQAGGPGGIHVIKVTVAPGDTSIGKQYPPSYGFTQDDTTTYSDRTITVSQTCADFSASAQKVTQGFASGTIRLVTSGDSRSGQQGIGTVSPGVWYINTRNDTCVAGANCSFTGIYRNFNF